MVAQWYSKDIFLQQGQDIFADVLNLTRCTLCKVMKLENFPSIKFLGDLRNYVILEFNWLDPI